MTKKKKKPKAHCKVCGREFDDKSGTGVCPDCRRRLPDERQVLRASAERGREGA